MFIYAINLVLIFTFAFQVPSQICCSKTHKHNDLYEHGLSAITWPNLRHAIKKYYVLESNNAWKGTYSFRTPKFKDLVPYGAYVLGMSKGYRDWSLLGIDVRGINCNSKSKCVIVVRFIECVTGESRKKYTKNMSNSVGHTERTVWEKVDNKWLVLDAGTRSHLPLNANISYN